MNKNFKKIIFTATLTACMAAMTTGVFGDSLLKYGSRGSSVTQLQTTLKEKKFFTVKATGYFGSITKASVKRFQKVNGLEADGIAGSKTFAKLYAKSKQLSTLKTMTSRGTTSITQQTKDDIYWLSRIINAEAGGQSYEGKLAVGNVILNRVKSSKFPDTIKEVIFERNSNKAQFTPTTNGAINNTPNADSIKAAKEVLEGKSVVEGSTYFFNPKTSKGEWIVKNKEYFKTIGSHAFYR